MTENALQMSQEELERLAELVTAVQDSGMAVVNAFVPMLDEVNRSLQKFGVDLANFIETLSDEDRLLLGLGPKKERI